MPALSESRPLRLFVLSALYLAQGLPWGFISVSYVVFLTDLGLDNDAIGSALALAYLPWSFKLVAGPFLDRIPVGRFGRRRPVIIVAELLMGATLLLLLGVDPVKEQGLVKVRRGRILIMNRDGLLDIAGKFYGVPEAELLRLLG